MIDNFTLAHHRLTLEALDPLHLPPFEGSALRGGFGRIHTAKRPKRCQSVPGTPRPVADRNPLTPGRFGRRLIPDNRTGVLTMQTWRSFKAATGDGRFQDAVRAVEAVIRRLASQPKRPGAVLSVVLFGSLAQRHSTYDDIALLVVVEPGSGSTSEVTRWLAEGVFGPLFLEYGQLFSHLVYTPHQLAQLRDVLPLLDEIKRDGVLLYGRDPFTQTAG